MADDIASTDSPTSTARSDSMSQLSSRNNAEPGITLNEAADLMLRDLDLSPLTKTTYRHGLNALLRHLHARDGDDVGVLVAVAQQPCRDVRQAFRRDEPHR